MYLFMYLLQYASSNFDLIQTVKCIQINVHWTYKKYLMFIVTEQFNKTNTIEQHEMTFVSLQ